MRGGKSSMVGGKEQPEQQQQQQQAPIFTCDQLDCVFRPVEVPDESAENSSVTPTPLQ